MVAITATDPRLTPTTSHRIQLCIYMNPLRHVRCYYCLLWLALCFSVTSSIVPFMATSSMSFTYSVVLLIPPRTSCLQVESRAAVVFRNSLLALSMQADSFFSIFQRDSFGILAF